jgi:hypothetical protein
MAGIILPPAVSQNEKAIQHLFNHQMLTSLGSNAPELIELFNFPISLTDAQTGKCILTNSHDMYLHKGLETLQSPNDLVGLSADDMLDMQCFIPPRILEKTILKINPDNASRAYAEMMNRLDHEVKTLKVRIKSLYTTILGNGFIYSKLLIKQPILSRDQCKVIAILNCCYDCTPTLSLLELLQRHRDIYPDKFAIKVLLQYLNIADYFKAPPSAREMQVLLLMRENSRRKYIANQLNITDNTAASHIQHIKELKLIKPDIDKVTIQLRRVPAGLKTELAGEHL